jgi:hypothetical protein
MMRKATLLLAVAALSGPLATAHAAPPTVTPSPGYDARLQEQRAGSAANTYQPAAPAPTVSRRNKRSHRH